LSNGGATILNSNITNGTQHGLSNNGNTIQYVKIVNTPSQSSTTVGAHQPASGSPTTSFKITTINSNGVTTNSQVRISLIFILQTSLYM
jgi:hypothetical protein